MIKRSVQVIAALLALVVVGLVVALIGTDYSWYQSLGFGSVFATSWASRSLTLAFFVVVTYVLFLLTLFIVRRRVQPMKSRAASFTTHTVALLLSVLASLQISSQWRIFRLAISGHHFGQIEPFTKLDVSFFVFSLPALERLASWLLSLVVLEGIWIALLIVYLPKRTGTPNFGEIVRPYVRPLLAILMVVIGFNVAVSAFGLFYAQSGIAPGLSFVDARVYFPGLLVTGAGAVVVALVIGLCGVLGKRKKISAAVFGLWALLAFVWLTAAPALVKVVRVAPNEMTSERPFIAEALKMTRAAWGLDKVATDEYPALPVAPVTKQEAYREELGDARIWTPSSLKQAFTQLETIRPYYQLSSIQPDRYQVAGRAQEVLSVAREINVAGLPKSARNWINRHLVYTHGYGMSVASATAVDAGGFPQFWVSDVPPVLASAVATCAPALETEEPRLYFGEQTKDWVVTNTLLDEFDHTNDNSTGADKTKNASYRYKGTSGITLDSFAQRALWALRLGSKDLLFSSYITSDSQLLINRSVSARVAKVAPWLELSDKPYAALVEGRIFWIVDAYTSSDHFPFSKAVDGVNYRRNSVKAVVDAYSGDVKLYAFGDDPIRDAWATMYPGTVTTAEQTPDALVAHFRYPTSLFKAQAQVFASFHIDNPEVYYNKEDLWGQFSSGSGSEAVELAPSYHLLTLANESATTAEASYALVLPYSMPGKDNMVALFVASSNPQTYGQLTVLRLPREHITLGPNQILARIQQDPVIAPQIALWNQNGNTVMYGDMLILPIQDTLAYVQPVFLKAKNAAITEVVGVVVVNNDEVRMGTTLAEALNKTER